MVLLARCGSAVLGQGAAVKRDPCGLCLLLVEDLSLNALQLDILAFAALVFKPGATTLSRELLEGAGNPATLLCRNLDIMMVALFWHCNGLLLELYFQLVSHSTAHASVPMTKPSLPPPLPYPVSADHPETVAGSVALRCRLPGNHQRCLTLF